MFNIITRCAPHPNSRYSKPICRLQQYCLYLYTLSDICLCPVGSRKSPAHSGFQRVLRWSQKEFELFTDILHYLYIYVGATR